MDKSILERKFGFTLAEVLITLGVIGVVAAMTLPVLIGTYQKQATVNQLKKLYTSINQAYLNSQAENGPSSSWTYPTSNSDVVQSLDFWNKYFIPYSKFSVVKECTQANYTDCKVTDAKFLDGTAMTMATYYQVLADGSLIEYRTVPTNGDAQFYVDVNGFKKPNVVGRDIFYIVMSCSSLKVSFGGLGIDRNILLTQNQAAYCEKSVGSVKGSFCGAVIIQDGWQIADDYPWN